MHNLVYIIGAPAAGKSALMAELTRNCQRLPADSIIPHEVLVRAGFVTGAELGRRRPDFPGTDALSMSIYPKAREFMESHFYRLVLGEGNRLGNTAFIEAAQRAGYDVTLIHLVTDPEILAERRKDRTQNEQWAKGAASQAANLAASTGAAVTEADGGTPLKLLAAELMDTVPALGVLK